MANLYDLSAGWVSLLNAYDAAETQDERDEIMAMLTDTQGDIESKAEDYAKVIRIKEAEAETFAAEIKRLTARKKAAENVVQRLKESLLDAMKLTGTDEIKTSIGKWRIQNNPWSAEVVDWERVPIEFRTPQPDKVDSKALIARFKETGEIIEGVVFRQERGLRFR